MYKMKLIFVVKCEICVIFFVNCEKNPLPGSHLRIQFKDDSGAGCYVHGCHYIQVFINNSATSTLSGYVQLSSEIVDQILVTPVLVQNIF